MSAEHEKPPVFGGLSLLAPFLGIPLAFVLALNTSGDGEGWGRFAVLVGIGIVSVLCGAVSAFIGLIRSEKFSFLSWLGLLLNGSAILWLCMH